MSRLTSARVALVATLFGAGLPDARALAQSVEPVPEEPPSTVLPPSPVGIDEAIAVAITVPVERLDAAAFGRALARDLDVHVALVVSGEGRPPREADVRIELLAAEPPDVPERVRLTVRRADGVMLVRETETGTDPSALADVLALLAGNLLRNESEELLALLRVEAVPRAPEDTPLEPAAEAPAPAPVVEVEPEPAPLQHAPVAIDFAPGLGFSTAYVAGDARNASIGVVGGLVGAIDGVGMSSVIDVVVRDVSGVQMAGVMGITGGDLHGVSLAGVGSIVAGDVEGVQSSSVLSVAAGDLSGVQLGVVDVTAGDVRGATLGVVNVAGGSVEGLQLGVINAVGQARISGLQLGIVNTGLGDVHGLQLGLVNVAGGDVHGLQLGLINVARRSDASIGLISVEERGRTRLRLGVDTNGFFSLGVVHGSGIFRSIFETSVEPFLASPAVALGFGIGIHGDLADIVDLDVELVQHAVLDEHAFTSSSDFMSDVRAVVTVDLDRWVALYASLGARLYVAFRDQVELGSPLEVTLSSSSSQVRLWPTVGGGVVFF